MGPLSNSGGIGVQGPGRPVNSMLPQGVNVSSSTYSPSGNLLAMISRGGQTDMIKTFILLLFVISISTRICQVQGDDREIPSKLDGNDLCRLGSFLTNEDRVAVKEIRVEDIQHVPLTPSGNHVNVKPKASVVVLTRNLLGSGAHRELRTEITLEFELDGSSNSNTNTSQLATRCDLIIFEKLSNGIFADPFQLQRLKQQDAFKKTHIYGDADLERPARTSYQSIVEIHTALVEKEAEAETVGVLPTHFQANVSLPLHARYPPIGTDTYFQLNITMPQVMVKCENSGDSSAYPAQETCIHPVTNIPSQTLHWFIPTGSALYSSLVDSVTTGAAIAGVVSILGTSKMFCLMNNPKRT